MPIYSGHIGEQVEFNVGSAGSVTGVKFGVSSVSTSFSVQPDGASVLARVPTDAQWGVVTFYKRPQVEMHNVIGSGYANTGALNDLQNNINALNLSSTCESGAVSYSNTYEATQICELRATGVSELGVSGVIYDAYGSGLCGNNADGFVSSGYSTADTRLNEFSTFQNKSGEWLGIGFVEDTGNFVYKTAKVEVTCTESSQESTPYSFVPIPLITDFNPKEVKQGDSLKIDGHAFVGVTNVEVNNVNVNHQVVNNSYISGSVPSGTFAHKIKLTGPSGVTALSLDDLVSFSPLAGGTEDNTLKIVDNQSTSINQGDAENVSIFGENVTGLTSAALIDENLNSINVFIDPSFSYNSNTVSFSPQNLQVGVYDLVLTNLVNTASGNNILTVLGEPSFSYDYVNTSSSNLIEEPQIFNDRPSVQTTFANKAYNFATNEDADRFCLKFNNNEATSGIVAYELQRPVVNPAQTHIDKYFIKSSGVNLADARSMSAAKWNSGIYTYDAFGYYYDSYSYKLDHCFCRIIDSGDSLYGVNENAVYADLFATGLAQTGDDAAVKQNNENNINQQLSQNYPNYTLASLTHNSSVEAVPYTFSSGIDYPFPTNILTNCSDSFWDKLYDSGKAELYPHGYTTGIASSGCSHTNSSSLTYNTSLSGVGKSESAAKDIIEIERGLNYVNCQTGNASVSTITITESITRSGITYGYC